MLDTRTDPPNEVRVRLESIDCPEKKQAFGNKAKQHLSDLVAGKTVTVHETGQDFFKRTLAFVSVGNVDVCAAMIRDGYAWEYDEYSLSETFGQLEQEARDAKRGLWGGSETPVEPWKFRKQR